MLKNFINIKWIYYGYSVTKLVKIINAFVLFYLFVAYILRELYLKRFSEK
jgi:hypothetical protein